MGKTAVLVTSRELWGKRGLYSGGAMVGFMNLGGYYFCPIPSFLKIFYFIFCSYI